MGVKIRRTASKPTDEWGTPWWAYKLLDGEFGFELDVCASDTNHKHDNYLTIKDDALVVPHWAKVNFCNPPYSDILPWYKQGLGLKHRDGSTTVFFTKYDPSTRHGAFANQKMDEIRILEHRIAFDGAPSSANFPVAVFIMRPRLYTRKTDAKIHYVDYRELIV